MKFITCSTDKLSQKDWESFANNFNKVFKKGFTVEYFKNKYLYGTQENSYHSFLLNEEDEIVGATNAIPSFYYKGTEKFKAAIGVDTFICEEYRKNPLLFHKIYTNIKKELKENNIDFLLSLPNDNSYLYKKRVLKIKDVGMLDYWVLPVRLANIKNYKFKILNLFSVVYAHTACCFSKMLSVFGIKANEKKYRIDTQDFYYQNRFNEDYTVYKNNDIFFAYKIYDEDGVKTAYILEATIKGKRSLSALSKVVSAILKDKAKIDLIIFVGTLGFKQPLLLKLPKKLEPKKLHLMNDPISNEELYEGIYDMGNWDFSLLNYDVR